MVSWAKRRWAIGALVALAFALVAATAGNGAVTRQARSTCGTERWSIKTLSDPGALSVSLTPRSTTIAALRARTAPATLASSRIGPVELTTYRIHARLVEFKLEADSDVHLVVADPSTGGTMIVEFPASACLSATRAIVRSKISATRAALIAACGQPSSTHLTHLTGAATITGVGFWDYQHGQTGVAPNAIELHPVLAVSGVTC